MEHNRKQELNHLFAEIEKKRQELYDLQKKHRNFQNPEVIQTSESLDSLLNQLFHMKQRSSGLRHE